MLRCVRRGGRKRKIQFGKLFLFFLSGFRWVEGDLLLGTGRFLRQRNSKIRIIAVEPEEPLHGLEGLKHMASSMVPGIYHEEELDEKIPVSTDHAYTMVYRLSQEEGVLVGQSSGAALHVTLEVAKKLSYGTLVTIFPDFGGRYLTTPLSLKSLQS